MYTLFKLMNRFMCGLKLVSIIFFYRLLPLLVFQLIWTELISLVMIGHCAYSYWIVRYCKVCRRDQDGRLLNGILPWVRRGGQWRNECLVQGWPQLTMAAAVIANEPHYWMLRHPGKQSHGQPHSADDATSLQYSQHPSLIHLRTTV